MMMPLACMKQRTICCWLPCRVTASNKRKQGASHTHLLRSGH
jgi:hypothetical protein